LGELIWLLASWLVAGIVLFVALRRRKTISVGLPIAYFVGLFIIHWPGAAVYLVPGHYYYNPEIVMAGFRLTTLGLWAYVVGVLLGGLKQAWGALPTGSGKGVGVVDTGRIYETAKMVFAAGLFIQLIVMPLLSGVATLTAILAGMAGLSVVGVCLGIRGALIQRDKKRLRIWILIALLFPFITLTSSAFVGYGVHSLIVVFAFIMMQTRTSMMRVLTILLAVYLGISFFVTYMRDRSEIRATIWYEQADYSARLKQVSKLFTDFEFFDAENPDHRISVDRRLNQNWLVGAAKNYVGYGNKDFANGETMWFALAALIPRVIWPDKPAVGGGGDIVSDYTGIMFTSDTSVGAGQTFEFYINFGTWGVALGFVLLGAAMRQFDARAAGSLIRHDYRKFLIWFLPGLGFLQAGGNLVEVTTSVGAGIAGALIVGKVIERRLRRKRRRQLAQLHGQRV
jgi:hypothetical protein